jgi:DNA-binding MarR family transcriptional regulator
MDDTMDSTSRLTCAHTKSAAFLLVQLGLHGARLFKERLASLDIEPRHFGLLQSIAAVEGRSQQALAELLCLPKSRMVWLIDDLERHGLVERRRNPTDRRAHALYLTSRGHHILHEAMEASATHEAHLLRTLQPAEREHLSALLWRLAADQGILGEILPGRPSHVEAEQSQCPEQRPVTAEGEQHE